MIETFFVSFSPLPQIVMNFDANSKNLCKKDIFPNSNISIRFAEIRFKSQLHALWLYQLRWPKLFQFGKCTGKKFNSKTAYFILETMWTNRKHASQHSIEDALIFMIFFMHAKHFNLMFEPDKSAKAYGVAFMVFISKRMQWICYRIQSLELSLMKSPHQKQTKPSLIAISYTHCGKWILEF